MYYTKTCQVFPLDLTGLHDATNRFYLEDLAIGLMRPPFNVDLER
jgi:hypothetical protein